jgi:hypothetical protein
MRQGLISSKAANKFLAGTRAQNSKMADFNDKAGKRDQGGTKDRGAGEARTSHIDTRQTMGSKAKASGEVSKGGRVHGGQKQPAKRDHIDAGALERPNFAKGTGLTSKNSRAKAFVKAPTPGGGKASPSKGAKFGTPKRARKAPPAQGGQYGGGGRNTQ